MTINVDKKTIIGYLIEAVIFIALLAGVWGYYNKKLNTSEQNIKAMKGKVEVIELQNKELIYTRDLYFATINDLEELLDITKKQANDIQRRLDSKIAHIAQLEQEVKIEYVEVVKDSIVYITKDKLVASFHYEDDWLNFDGENTFNTGGTFNYTTIIKNIKISAPLTVGLSDNYKIFVTTPNPYISFTEIEGVVIDKSIMQPKKKRFGWGIHGGFGVMYDVIDKDVAVGPTASFGVHINF